MLGKDPGTTLRNLIDPQDLLKPYGGELEWKYENDPSLDAPVKEAIGEMPRDRLCSWAARSCNRRPRAGQLRAPVNHSLTRRRESGRCLMLLLSVDLGGLYTACLSDVTSQGCTSRLGVYVTRVASSS